MPNSINFKRFAERKRTILIKRIKEHIENILVDKIILEHLIRKTYSLEKEIILETLIQEFNNSHAKYIPGIIFAVNIGFLSCSESTPRSQDIVFLNFIIEKMFPSKEYYDYGITSLFLLLKNYSEYDTNLLLNQIQEDKKKMIYDSVINGLTERREIVIPNKFLNKIEDKVQIKYYLTQDLHYRNLFSKIFNYNNELLKLYWEPIINFIDLNINRIFIDWDVLTMVKPVYINSYSSEVPIFKKIDEYLEKNLDNLDYLPKIINFGFEISFK